MYPPKLPQSNSNLNDNSTSLSNVPNQVLKDHIGPKLGLGAMSQFSQADKKLSLLFQQPLQEAREAEPLLLCIAQGKEDEAEEMIKANPLLLKYKSKTKDYSDRVFEGITAFQLALWYKDTKMWKMILKYLPREETTKQLHEHLYVNMKYKQINGDAFDFNPLIDALQTQFVHLRSWTDEEREAHWCKKVGGAQRMVPVHVANEYCNSIESFTGTRKFTEKDVRPDWYIQEWKDQGVNVNFRNTIFYNYGTKSANCWFPLESNPGLGSDFAITRPPFIGKNPARGQASTSIDEIKKNLADIKTLSLQRTKEIEKLAETLLTPVNNNCYKP